MSYTLGIPAANNNPSADQPLMLGNFTAINNWTLTDHIGFNTAAQGQHKQVTFNDENVPATPPTDPVSILYTNTIATSGAFNTASATTFAEAFFANQQATFPISMIKAFGCFDSAGNPLNTWNLAKASNATGVFTINMPTNCVTGTSYIIVATAGYALAAVYCDYTIVSATQFKILTYDNTAKPANPSQFSVIVMQL